MLTGLYIQNLAVIEEVFIEFGNAMNVFTGETGAGKSIVIDAIGAVMGKRCFKTMVRSGAHKAVIIATFRQIPKEVEKIAESYDIPLEEDELIIERDILEDGKTSARIQGRPFPVSVLQEFGMLLVNIHGQHDNQILLSAEKHIDILDAFGENLSLLSEYQEYFERLHHVNSKLQEIQLKQQGKKERLEILKHQIQEISAAELKIGEDKELEDEICTIKNAEAIAKDLQEAYERLNGTEESNGALSQIDLSVRSIEAASRYIAALADTSNQMRDIYYDLEALTRTIYQYKSELNFDDEKLEICQQRLDEIYRLKRKYSNSIEKILMIQKEKEQELEQLETYDVRMNELIVEQKKLQRLVTQYADRLSKVRREAAQNFVNLIAKELNFLNMKGVRFEVQFKPSELSNKGQEKIEFLISTNLGERPKAIAKIASGGELSRIMLAVKNVLADKDQIPTLIFDEIDQGVSGSSAQKIGLKIKQASINRQILCVTHLAQIAAMADNHYKIFKEIRQGRVFTNVHSLSREQRIEELAKIISTGEVTPLLRQTAEELLQRAESINF